MKQKTKTNLFVDILIFVLFLIAYEQRATGTAIHEWLGVVLGLVFLLHIILHWKWITACTRQFLTRLKAESRINYILDIFIYIGFTTIIFTGIMISESFLPTFGIRTFRSHYWQEIHSMAVDITLFFVAIHFAMHWKWIVNNFKRFIIDPIQNRPTENNKLELLVSRTSNIRSGYFSTFARYGLQVILILALSGLISIGWYAAAGTGASEPQFREYRQGRGRNAESGFKMERNNRPERAGHGPRGRHAENGHHNEEGFIGMELVKNLLIFAFVTVVITKFSSLIKKRKEAKVVVKG